jgi:hypothetical protein
VRFSDIGYLPAFLPKVSRCSLLCQNIVGLLCRARTEADESIKVKMLVCVCHLPLSKRTTTAIIDPRPSCSVDASD